VFNLIILKIKTHF